MLLAFTWNLSCSWACEQRLERFTCAGSQGRRGSTLEPLESEPVTCRRCEGNGSEEVVTRSTATNCNHTAFLPVERSLIFDGVYGAIRTLSE